MNNSRNQKPVRSRRQGSSHSQVQKHAALSPSRRMALNIGSECRQRDAFASELLENHLCDDEMSPSDKAFCRKLTLGVASTWGTLDFIINRNLNSPKDISPSVRDALRVSTYEMVFLAKQGHAAVDQGVELVRSIAPKAAGLANAVLRKIALDATRFPYGNPETSVEAAGCMYGFPGWMASLLTNMYGPKRANEFMDICNQQAPVYVSINAIKFDDNHIVSLLKKETSVELRPVRLPSDAQPIPGCYQAQDAAVVGSGIAHHLFSEGAMLVSDAAAQYVAHLALPDSFPNSFLEVGSGRGTKTLMLQSNACRRWGKQMPLTALDAHGFKGDLLQNRAALYQAQLDATIEADARHLDAALGNKTFDAAFIDAPCSGLGTLRRHPELRWRLNPADIEELASVQLDMLSEVARFVTVGGQLTYATCTVAPAENERVIAAFLKTDVGQGYRIVPCGLSGKSDDLFFRTPLVSNGTDAHFACVLRRVTR